jgi:hypothetical protein
MGPAFFGAQYFVANALGLVAPKAGGMVYQEHVKEVEPRIFQDLKRAAGKNITDLPSNRKFYND